MIFAYHPAFCSETINRFLTDISITRLHSHGVLDVFHVDVAKFLLKKHNTEY